MDKRDNPARESDNPSMERDNNTRQHDNPSAEHNLIHIKKKHREKGLCHFLCASFLFNQRSSVHAYQDQTDATALPKLSTVI